MQLTYRGVKYDYNPPTVEMKAADEAGKFRGVDIRFRTVKRNPVQQPTLDLKYRGVCLCHWRCRSCGSACSGNRT